MKGYACSRCGAERDDDLSLPCELCGSKEWKLVGYGYDFEKFTSLFSLILPFAVIIILAILIVVMNPVIVILFLGNLH
jgi:hypothetical protein